MSTSVSSSTIFRHGRSADTGPFRLGSWALSSALGVGPGASPTHVRVFVDVNTYESPLLPPRDPTQSYTPPESIWGDESLHLFNTGVLDYMEEHPEMIDHFLPTDRYASEEDRYRAEQAAQSVARIKFYRIQNMNKAEWERVEDKKKNCTLSRAATSSRPHSAAPSLFQPPSRVASSASNASTDIFASLSTTSTALPSRGPSVAQSAHISELSMGYGAERVFQSYDKRVSPTSKDRRPRPYREPHSIASDPARIDNLRRIDLHGSRKNPGTPSTPFERLSSRHPSPFDLPCTRIILRNLSRHPPDLRNSHPTIKGEHPRAGSTISSLSQHRRDRSTHHPSFL